MIKCSHRVVIVFSEHQYHRCCIVFYNWKTNKQRVPHFRKRSTKGFPLSGSEHKTFVVHSLSKIDAVILYYYSYYSSLEGLSLLFESDRGFFTIPLSEDFFTIPVRQRILYHSSPKGFLYHSSPTEDSLPFLSQRISLLFESDRGFFTIPLSEDFFIFQSDRGFFIILEKR